MLKHYTNKLYREDADEIVADLLGIGIDAIIGDPGPSAENSGAAIKAMGLGVVGVWIETEDSRSGKVIVNEAWDIHYGRVPA